jgi:hypothetical protein
LPLTQSAWRGRTMRIDDQTTVADYLVLGTWEALTLLGEAR